MSKSKNYISWSGGKDAALALYIAQKEGIDVSLLFTSVQTSVNRVSMHGVRMELIEKQAEIIGLPLHTVGLSPDTSMESYKQLMERETLKLKDMGYSGCVFGDIFLEDLKNMREEQLKSVGMKAYFPIFNRNNTKDLLLEWIDLGFRAKIVCCSLHKLDKSFLGRDIDVDFLNDLPENVDPCGENGEFHTLIYDGPIFKKPLEITTGEIIERTYEASTPGAHDTKFGFIDVF
ncbi:Dph6-related ATP pyrophosphatase [Marinigracilibium pacificum]|uniref:Diphthine--ammonia ligase n=1 Tax=Marinigracilibium pacificum TaxID=2729599 RepID=A0A848J570_9BACT|nr:diphthine--ammonia ligase [Marinigracilibium pacificum]NMM49499.1 diphthine--ammonia ligase [Marinigracilibium pacificum]